MVPSKVKECFDITFCYYANHHYSNVHNIMSLHASFLNFCSHRILQAGFFILDCDVTSPVYVSSVGSAKMFFLSFEAPLSQFVPHYFVYSFCP